jgi:hypothetical protein
LRDVAQNLVKGLLEGLAREAQALSKLMRGNGSHEIFSSTSRRHCR